MDIHALEHYSAYSEKNPHGHFHEVISLHEDPLMDWHKAFKLAPCLCKGWYELAQLGLQDRIDFTREFWQAKLPYHPQLQEVLNEFFASLDDIGVFLTQQKYDDLFESRLVYSLKDNGGFYHGGCYAKESAIIALQKEFSDYILPLDYVAFLQIHDGFAKGTDTGVIPSIKMLNNYETFQQVLEQRDPLVTEKGAAVNPKSLIPFYESFGQPFFQCFWGEWYPDQEMGNIYYSNATRIISVSNKKDECLEKMAFETFSDWLMFYLEKFG